MPAALDDTVKTFVMTVYEVNEAHDIELVTHTFSSKVNYVSFASRKPGHGYRFALQMRTAAQAEYGSPGILTVSGTCPNARECCLFFNPPGLKG